MFQAENTEIVGISANAAFSQKAFADFAKINYALLSDRDGKVMAAKLVAVLELVKVITSIVPSPNNLHSAETST